MVLRRGSTATLLFLVLALAPTALGKWQGANATFYTGNAQSWGGACGYTDVDKLGYGEDNVALSSALFREGHTCGACFQVRCVDSQWCRPGAHRVTVTATNFCPANAPNTPPWCNSPRKHFDMSQTAWEKIGIYAGGVIPIEYRRVKCVKSGGIRFTMNGNDHWNLVLVSNVGRAGAVRKVMVKATNSTEWIRMHRNWGQNWQTDAPLTGKALSFKVQTTDWWTVVNHNVVPENWSFGQTFEGKRNF